MPIIITVEQRDLFSDHASIISLTKPTQPKSTRRRHRAVPEGQYALFDLVDFMIHQEPAPSLPASNLPPPDSPSCEFSQEEVEELQYLLLHKSIRALFHHQTSATDRLDILTWLQIDEFTPFSFPVCAKVVLGAQSEFEDFRSDLISKFVNQYPGIPVPDHDSCNSWNCGVLCELSEIDRVPSWRLCIPNYGVAA